MSGVATAEERQRLQTKFADALGSDLGALLEDALVSDVLINADGAVFVERVGETMAAAGFSLQPARRAALIKTAVTLGVGAQPDGWPILETRIPGRGWRFEGLLPPVVAAPVIAIRKPARHIYPLRSYVDESRMSAAIFEALSAAVEGRQNILIVGGTGSGKTTLANALLALVAVTCPAHRVLLLEDTPELQCACENSVAMTSSHAVSLLDLLRASMRLRPDRIVVGEVRGPEVLTMLSAWNTGHPGGLCTVHADSARGGLLRLEQLCAQGGVREGARQEIAQAVHVVVHIERVAGKRSVRELMHVEGITAAGEYACTRTQ